ncbi:MAG TPA: hypothetical protein VMS17_05310 [Gemmataceae bacterium]|nr:hypothetical protein [Gemmataceae bacterium]
MGRPRKKPEDRKDYHLRVPLDEAQRALIDQAAALSRADKAEWARTVLLDAAKRMIAQGKPR